MNLHLSVQILKILRVATFKKKGTINDEMEIMVIAMELDGYLAAIQKSGMADWLVIGHGHYISGGNAFYLLIKIG